MGEVEPDWQSCVTLPSIAPAAPESFQLSQYCFIRNRLMLTADPLPPSRSLAQLIQTFHELPSSTQAQLLPHNLPGDDVIAQAAIHIVTA
jgi:hypothetical protein